MQQRAGNIVIKQLSKSYPMRHEQNRIIFKDIDLDVKAGDFFSILGEKGSGKSTLLRLLFGLEHQYQGEILIDGERIYGTSPKRAMLCQAYRLFPWLNIRENIRIALHQSNISRLEEDHLIDEYLDLVELTQFAHAYPSQLSLGMNHRVALARCLVTQPEVLLLDDPFGSLDALTRQSLQEVLQDIWQTKNITVILVAHDLDEALFLSQRIAFLHGTPSKVDHCFAVTLSYPRKRTDLRFQTLKNNLSVEMYRHVHQQGSATHQKIMHHRFTW